VDEALGAFEAAIEAAGSEAADAPTLAEALRRLAVLLQRRGEAERAFEACHRSYAVATAAGHVALRAEALNTLGGLELMRESLDEAQHYLDRALELSEPLPELRGRIEQNLGILCNIRRDRVTAREHYQRSLEAFLTAGSEHGCAVAYNNLGMLSADEKQWEAADQYFEQGRRTAQGVGDDHLRGLCLTNRVEVLIALQRFDTAQIAAETALSIFEELRAPAAIADVQRMLGIVFRETGRLGLAQSRLEVAVELAGESGSPVSHGDALCETGRLHGRLGHIDVAIDYLLRSGRRFGEVLEALHGPEVLSGEYPNIVRAWSELLQKVDPNAAVHTDRAAQIAGAIAAELGLPTGKQVAIRLAAQLHEVDRVRSSTGTAPTGPAAAADLLDAAGCFAEAAAIVRGLEDQTDRLPVAGQIVRLADRYARLTDAQARSTREQALGTLGADRARWRGEVWEALERVTEALPTSPAKGPEPGL
jgi:tetratricopeptide (TPR) repeat protein